MAVRVFTEFREAQHAASKLHDSIIEHVGATIPDRSYVVTMRPRGNAQDRILHIDGSLRLLTYDQHGAMLV